MLPENGQGVRIKAPGLPGTGEVIHIIPAGQAVSQEAVMRFYGVTPDTHLEDYRRVSRPLKVARIVVQRDDGRGYVIYPPELFNATMLDLLVSPRCKKCQQLSPLQKWTNGECPKCGNIQDNAITAPWQVS